MMDTNILDLLEDIGLSSVARLEPAVALAGDTALERREKVLQSIRGTVLPRRLEFTAANGDCLAIEVNSSRVTDVFRVRSGVAPDFETEERDTLAGQLAQLVTDIAAAPAPLNLISLRPDATLEADDVGITFSEIASACTMIEMPAEPVIAVVPDTAEPANDVEAADEASDLATQFYQRSQRLAVGRIQVKAEDGGMVQSDGDCSEDQPFHADQTLLTQFARDLSGWDDDAAAALDHPQLIVMRPSGGKGSGLAVLNDGKEFSIVVHEARKLGAIVNLWTSLTERSE
ncbi:hypothetical protein [Ruegeria atlantica]|uniref:Uncharacterized protein n=1 Tax=Ruegeria atlantica TaxID=81569 RepID=A0A0P1E398_9RHOB|nr:hypothetical protein [Ruegeria atlantica]CUH41848.1 hypothetical protein RUM4293_00732 [Ruegeria atlantica]